MRVYTSANQGDFGALFNVTRDNIASYERGTEPKISFLASVADHFHITLEDLIHTPLSPEKLNKGAESVPAADNFVTIPVVSIEAAAGGGATNPDYIDQEDILLIPRKRVKPGKKCLCIKIKGHSMTPTLQDNGYVIIRLLDTADWYGIKDKHIHVVTDREGNTYIKRVRNHLRDRGYITLKSDNPEKNIYPDIIIEGKDILNIWFVEYYLSGNLPDFYEQYDNRLDQIEDEMSEVRLSLKKIGEKLGV